MMFRSARLKLTGWYLLIIMLISLLFSVVIYQGIDTELERGFSRAELRLKAEEMGIRLPHPIPPRLEQLRPELRNIPLRSSLLEDLEAARQRVILFLLLANGVILIVSGVAGYFLAGKTLKPIEEALEEQKRFVADASHELRTPLAAQKTSIEVALRDKSMTEKEARTILESNLEDINKLQSLTDNLLELAQQQESNGDIVPKPTNLKEVIENACKKIQPLAKKKGIDIKFSAEKHSLEADKTSLQEMVTIFLDNAVKYTPKGGKISVTIESDKKSVFVRIKDTGIGIDEKDLPHIFDRFYRVDKSRSRTAGSGFGLGLSLARKTIQAHRGSVHVASIVGKGTTFIIRLPLKHS